MMNVTLRYIAKEVYFSYGIVRLALSECIRISKKIKQKISTRGQSELRCTLMYNCSHSRLQGFTLIELLVVIAIISLLVSILLPSLNKAKSLARTVICQTRMKSVGIGISLYNSDNDGIMPTQVGLSGPGGAEFKQDASQPESWVYKLQPYIDAKKLNQPTVLTCSMAEFASMPPNSNWVTVSYWYNWYMSRDAYPVNISSIKIPSETIWLLDGSTAEIYSWAYLRSEILYAPSFYPHPERRAPEDVGAFRNLLFADSHSETVGSYTTNDNQMNNYGEWLP